MANQSSLKPVGKLFADSWKLYRKHMNLLALVGVIPLIFAGVRMVLRPGFIDLYGYPLWVLIAVLTVSAVFSLLYIVFALVMPIALAEAADQGHKGKYPEASQIYKKAFSEIIQYIFVIMLVAIVVMGGGILFIIPGIVAAIYLKFAIFTYLFEDARGMDALVKSAWYVRGSWWAIFFRNILLAIVLGLAGLIFAVVSGLVLIALGFNALLFGVIFQLFVFMILVPFAIVYMYVLYKDAKSAKEGKNLAKDFVDESENLFIILLIVAALATLIIFFLSTFANIRIEFNGYGGYNGDAGYSNMMPYGHMGYGRWNRSNNGY